MSFRLWCVTSGLLALAAAGPAQAVLRWDFKSRPTAAEVDAAWPKAAKARGLEGGATAVCLSDLDGKLTRCAVVAESPVGEGFGAALVSLAPSYQMGEMSPACAAAYNWVGISQTWTVKPRSPISWRKRPNGAEFWRAYPEKALREKTWGSVLLQCQVEPSGDLSGCRAVFEAPADAGMGAGAVSMTPRFKINPAKEGELPVPGVVVIPVNFMPAPTSCQK